MSICKNNLLELCSIWRKKCFHWQQLTASEKMAENNFHWADNQLSFSKTMLFRWKLNSYNRLHKQKNNSDQKTLFPLDRKSVSTNRMEDLLKDIRKSYTKKLLPLQKISEKFKKLVSISRNMVRLKNWLPPNFNNGFY